MDRDSGSTPHSSIHQVLIGHSLCQAVCWALETSQGQTEVTVRVSICVGLFTGEIKVRREMSGVVKQATDA